MTDVVRVAAPVRLTRNLLYDMVWSTPMRTLASRFGISDVGLAKICKRMGVPRPRRGYWAKRAAGQRLRRTSLPRRRVDQLNEVTLEAHQLPKLSAEAAAIVEGLRSTKPALTVPARLARPHPLVARTRDALSSGTVDSRGIVRCRESVILDVRVTRASLARALRIMNTLLRLFEARGWRVITSASYTGDSTAVEILGVDNEFDLFEAVRQTGRPANPGEPSWLQTYDYSPTGQLALRISHWTGRTRWADGKRRRLEDQLIDFLAGIVEAADETRTARARFAETERLAAEHERLRVRQAQHLERLKSQLSKWRTARELREYSSELAAAVERLGDSAPAALREWATWVDQQAKDIDPLGKLLILAPTHDDDPFRVGGTADPSPVSAQLEPRGA